jgi:aryl-alcohol dehydrogenase-like predicted oxidoreductase
VSVVGLGCNNFGRRVDLAGTRAVVDAALEEGVTFLDAADTYGGAGTSEEFLGQVLEGRRERVVLATKFGMDMGDGRGPRGSRRYIHHAVRESLRRLRTDVIDVYWYHEPDGITPIAETLEALDELVRAGTVRAIGASNFDARQIDEADRTSRERGLAHFAAVQNQERAPSMTDVAIGALLARPVISSVIAGATKPEQVRANAAAARWSPSTDDLWRLNELLVPTG